MKVVTIKPRHGVDAERVRKWLDYNFQRPGYSDDGERSSKGVLVTNGNPLVNADVTIADVPDPDQLRGLEHDQHVNERFG